MTSIKCFIYKSAVTLPGSERTICACKNTRQKVKKERNLEDDTFQVVCILTLFIKPSLYENYLVLLALGRKEPSGNGDFNAGYGGANMSRKNIVRNVTHIAASTDKSQYVNSFFPHVCEGNFVNLKLKKKNFVQKNKSVICRKDGTRLVRKVKIDHV